MSKINILDIHVANKIAAGEVIERPAAVVKELVENAIDAGADMITVEIQKGGISYIRVSDNGSGMSREDAPVAFLRHATSKIKSEEDLDAIYTLGFRGEALASVAAVSKVEMHTKIKENEFGTKVVIDGGSITEVSDAGCADGTTIIVRDLFYNTPARMKFLKKDNTEAGYITDILHKMVLANAHVSFKYINNGKEMFHTPGDNNLHNAIYTVYGRDYPKNMFELDADEGYIKVSGLAGKSEVARSNRNMQSFFINGRYVKSKMLTVALEEAYKGQLMVGKFPVAVIYLSIAAENIDINVHPTKMEVKFSNERAVYSAVYRAVKNALYRTDTKRFFDGQTEGADETSKKDEIKHAQAEQTAQPVWIEKNHVAGQTENLQIKTFELSSGPVFPEEENKDHFEPATQRTDYKVREEKAEFHTDMPEDAPKEEPAAEKDIFEIKEDKWNIIGQAFHTYIIAERADELIYVDQHAAHERILYEQLLKAHKEQKCLSQMLMVPEVVDLSSVEFDTVIENKKFFEELGFDFDIFGNNAIIVRSSPMDILYNQIKDLFAEIADMMINMKKETDVTDSIEHALHMVACRSAIKGNKTMSVKEMEQLLSDVFDLDHINTCPHGRPIVLTTNKKYIEKQFKRLV